MPTAASNGFKFLVKFSRMLRRDHLISQAMNNKNWTVHLLNIRNAWKKIKFIYSIFLVI